MSDHPLKGYYLTRIYHEGADPFAVVTDLPRDEAIRRCEEYAPQRRVEDKKGDQAAYMEGRIETENWLRESAQGSGVDIRKQHPIYFVLGDKPVNGPIGDDKLAVSIPAEQLDLSCCSFTVGDSMGNRTSKAPAGVAAHPLQDAVLNQAQIAAFVKQNGITADYMNGGRYIEAQLWARPEEIMTRAASPAASAPRATAKLAAASI